MDSDRRQSRDISVPRADTDTERPPAAEGDAYNAETVVRAVPRELLANIGKALKPARVPTVVEDDEEGEQVSDEPTADDGPTGEEVAAREREIARAEKRQVSHVELEPASSGPADLVTSRLDEGDEESENEEVPAASVARPGLEAELVRPEHPTEGGKRKESGIPVLLVGLTVFAAALVVYFLFFAKQ